MRVTCPHCSGNFILEEYLKDLIMVDVIRMLPDFGGHQRVVWEYAELFHIGPPLNARKLLRLLTEVRDFFNAGFFDYQRQRYQISRGGLAEALRIVCNAGIKDGLQNHNYLKKVAIGIAEKESLERGRGEEKQLRKKEERIRNEDRGPQIEVGTGVGGDSGEGRRAGNLGSLIHSFVKGLEGNEGKAAGAEEVDGA